jgi:bifunctional DNase/RNase
MFMPKMIEVVIDSVRVSLTNQQRIVVLREKGAERYLPIWIGPYEAEAITVALQEIEVARPQTHDLLKNILNIMNARLVRVEVISLREDVFYGNLVLETNGRMLNIDCRPSDALALAVRAHVPILVANEVMDSAGVIPEKDIAEKPAPPANLPPSPSPAEEDSEGRLSVFEDFLDKLDFDQGSKPSEGDEKPDDDEPDDKKKKK